MRFAGGYIEVRACGVANVLSHTSHLFEVTGITSDACFMPGLTQEVNDGVYSIHGSFYQTQLTQIFAGLSFFKMNICLFSLCISCSVSLPSHPTGHCRWLDILSC